jgi:PleD family two-component response regulator
MSFPSRLQQRPSRPTNIAAASTEARAVSGGTTSRPPPSAVVRRRVVLIVDNDANARGALAAELKSRFEVVEAVDGIDAIEKAGALPVPPVLIVSDVNLPRLDGFNLVKVLKGHPLLRSVPVVMFSSRNAASDVVTGLTLGVKQYLTKSIGTHEAAIRILKLVA